MKRQRSPSVERDPNDRPAPVPVPRDLSEDEIRAWGVPNHARVQHAPRLMAHEVPGGPPSFERVARDYGRQLLSDPTRLALLQNDYHFHPADRETIRRIRRHVYDFQQQAAHGNGAAARVTAERDLTQAILSGFPTLEHFHGVQRAILLPPALVEIRRKSLDRLHRRMEPIHDRQEEELEELDNLLATSPGMTDEEYEARIAEISERAHRAGTIIHDQRDRSLARAIPRLHRRFISPMQMRRGTFSARGPGSVSVAFDPITPGTPVTDIGQFRQRVSRLDADSFTLRDPTVRFQLPPGVDQRVENALRPPALANTQFLQDPRHPSFVSTTATPGAQDPARSATVEGFLRSQFPSNVAERIMNFALRK